MKKIICAAFLILQTTVTFAKSEQVTLEVPGMSCITCPFTVKIALQNVDGVAETETFYKEKLVVVTYDDEKTTVDALIEATTNAGYPSAVKQQSVD